MDFNPLALPAEASIPVDAAAQNDPAPQSDAQAQIDALRQARMDGKVGESEFHRRMGELGPQLMSEPNTSAVDPARDFERLRDEIMAGAKPQEYQFSYPPNTQFEGPALEFDSAVRNALSDAHVPKHLGPSIFSAVDRNARTFTNATPEAIEAHVSSVDFQLQQAWGAEAQARGQAVADLIVQIAEKHPVVREIMITAPHLLADAGLAQHLWSVIEQQSRKRS